MKWQAFVIDYDFASIVTLTVIISKIDFWRITENTSERQLFGRNYINIIKIIVNLNLSWFAVLLKETKHLENNMLGDFTVGSTHPDVSKYCFLFKLFALYFFN